MLTNKMKTRAKQKKTTQIRSYPFLNNLAINCNIESQYLQKMAIHIKSAPKR